MTENIDILLVEPGKAPRPAVVLNTIKAMEDMLHGSVQIGCFLPQKVLLVSREDTSGLLPNRIMPQGEEFVSGSFLLCGIDESCDFVSLTKKQQQAFFSIFEKPSEFMMIDGITYTHPNDAAKRIYGLWDTLKDGESAILTKWGGEGADICKDSGMPEIRVF